MNKIILFLLYIEYLIFMISLFITIPEKSSNDGFIKRFGDNVISMNFVFLFAVLILLPLVLLGGYL